MCLSDWGDLEQIFEGLLCLLIDMNTQKIRNRSLISKSCLTRAQMKARQFYEKAQFAYQSDENECVLWSNEFVFFSAILLLGLSATIMEYCFVWTCVLNNSWGLDLFPAFLLSSCWPGPFSEMFLFWNRSLLFCPEASWKTGHVQTRDKWLFSSTVFMIFYNSQLIFRDHLLQTQELFNLISRKSTASKPERLIRCFWQNSNIKRKYTRDRNMSRWSGQSTEKKSSSTDMELESQSPSGD